MTLFAGAALANAIGEVEGVPTRLTVLSCEGRSVPAIIAGDTPVTDRVWLDYLEPAEVAAEIPVRFLPRFVHAKVEAKLWLDELSVAAPASGMQPAPLIDFTQFTTWDEAAAWFQRYRSSHFKTLDRLHRKTEREIGPVSFNPADSDPAAFDQLIAWKRMHFARTGVGDPLAVRHNLELFRHLFGSGTLELSTLRGGDRLLAIIACVTVQGRVFYWMPSYDTGLSVLSPGNALLNTLIRHSFERGDHEFDFMIGDEGYKFHYATHARLVGSLGPVPVSRRVRRFAGQAKRRLQAVTAGAEET